MTFVKVALALLLACSPAWGEVAAVPSVDGDLSPALPATGRLVGQIHLPEGAALPSVLRSKYTLTDEREKRSAEVVSGVVECPVGPDGWECDVPAGTLQLRLEMEGYAPEYLWDVELERGEVTRVAPLSPKPGASLSGWVTFEDAGLREDLEADVEVMPLQLATSATATAQQQTALLKRSIPVDERGFFQVTGLAPGTYVVRASHGSLRSSRQNVTLAEPGKEVFLEEPLVLAPPPSVTVELEPPVDPWSVPWTIELLGRSGQGGGFVAVEKSRASADGLWRSGSLDDEIHRLKVWDSQGSVWLSESVDVYRGMKPLFYVIDVIPVRGTLERGGEGLEGEVIFKTDFGGASIHMKADVEGRFEGSLPYEGEWSVKIVSEEMPDVPRAAEPVLVRKKPGKSYAEVELTLPNTYLEGKVVEEGEPVAGALVFAIRDLAGGEHEKRPAGMPTEAVVVGARSRRQEFALMSRDDGTFEVRGISPGAFEVQASTADASSGWQTVDLQEGSHHPQVVLELQKRITVKGRVVHNSLGVPGAKIFTLPSVGVVPDTQTDAGGRFVLSLQRDLTHVDLIVLPPGAGLLLERVTLRGEDVDVLEIPVSAETGTLVVADPTRPYSLPKHPTFLHFQDAHVPLGIVSMLMRQANRSQGRTPGMTFQGVTPGTWSACRDSFFHQEDCVTAEVFPSSETILNLSLPEEKERE